MRVAAVALANDGKLKEAAAQVVDFHRQLCEVRVLDPACGSGNFLYVALEHLKRLEGEVLNTLDSFGQRRLDLEGRTLTVDPHQLLGIEINPRAAAITDLVLWIGYLQWHFRTRGDALPEEPVIRKFHNIECRDAVLAYDGTEPLLDEDGQPVMRWDGRSFRRHPATGQNVPDETAQVPASRYVNPHVPEWPQADFVVGNPPFVGKLYLLTALGEGYIEALRGAYRDAVPDGCDFVMYWWHRSAQLLRRGAIRRFGLITTKSISQTFNRRVVNAALTDDPPSHLAFAVPNHPWSDSAQSAAVRIAMTVAAPNCGAGTLAVVTREIERPGEDPDVELRFCTGKIHPDLSVGAEVTSASALQANALLASTGLILGSRGFVLTASEAEEIIAREPASAGLIYPLRNGHDLTDSPRGVLVIDPAGWSETELRARVPAIYQRLLERVYPERQTNRDPRLRAQWWLHRRSNQQVRAAIEGLPRYIATSETSRHRTFTFLEGGVRPEHKLVVIGSGDAFLLGVLSSRVHITWALAAGGRLGAGNDPVYAKTNCFDKFPFPDCDDMHRHTIADLAEQVDAHRKRQQAQHPRLTLTDMYNVLEKLRAGDPLTDRERAINEQGLVSTLKQLHDELDAAMFAAYGWPATLTDEEILERLVALNAERAAEERRGLIRWLRPEFQNPQGFGQTALETGEGEAPAVAAGPSEKLEWPKTLPEQAKAVRAALVAHAGVVTAAELARSFKGSASSRIPRVEMLLETLASLGQAREVEDGRFAA